MKHNPLPPSVPRDSVYRGYSIAYNLFRDEYNVSREGYHITTTRTVPEAREAIDALVTVYDVRATP